MSQHRDGFLTQGKVLSFPWSRQGGQQFGQLAVVILGAGRDLVLWELATSVGCPVGEGKSVWQQQQQQYMV